MSTCNFTKQIKDYECLGDSLLKINDNFYNLDSGLCNVPTAKAGIGIDVNNSVLTEQNFSKFIVSTHNSFDYRTTFDSYDNLAAETTIALTDQTTLKVTEFPYDNDDTDFAPKPIVTFTTTTLNYSTSPKVTLYWTASGTSNVATPGAENLTVHPLNSAVDESSRGPIWFDGSVNALLSSFDSLYVGGAFTSVGGGFAPKLVEVNTSSTSTGLLTSTPIPNLGIYGDIRVLREIKLTDYRAMEHTILVAGGSFESPGIRGKALVFLDKTTGEFYPWFVNGEVNDICLDTLDSETLFVGGSFDYVNYGHTSARISNQKIQTNGLFSINLQKVIEGLATVSITDYSQSFVGDASVNALAFHNGKLFVGGDFKIKNHENELINQHLYYLDTTNILEINYFAPDPNWQVILNGPVHALYVDDVISAGDSAYLYVGGTFKTIHTKPEFYAAPRTKLISNETNNAACFQLTNLAIAKPNPPLTLWKPNFRGAVNSFLAENNTVDAFIYCYGQFNAVNNNNANYLVAIKKACSPASGTLFLDWMPGIQRGPHTHSNSLINYRSNVLVGGNFSKVSNHFRYNLAEINTPVEFNNTQFVVWDCSGEAITPENKLSLDLYSSETKRVSSVPSTFETVNATVFEPMANEFKGLTPGQPIRFFIRRPGKTCNTDDTFLDKAYVIGWKVDFN